MKIKFLLTTSIILLMSMSACKKDSATEVQISQPVLQLGQAITSDTLSGSIKGTCLTGKTYYFKTDITVNKGDTLYIQPGVKIYALGDGATTASTPQVTVKGTLISAGTKDGQNYFTILPAQQTVANLTAGLWGGIQGDSASGDIILKWTHIEYAGGPAGPGSSVYAQGDPRYGLLFNNANANLILEDSWITGSKDDGMRVVGGKIALFRNTFEACGSAGGEAVNIKSGTVGDAAYNVCIGSATNGLKISNSGGSTIQANVNLYNNTIISNGLRQVKTGRGGSINIEVGGRSLIYNNLIVNSRFGFRMLKDADTLNTLYDYQFYYSNSTAMVKEFNATAGIEKTQPNDVRKDSVKLNNPQFVGFDVDKFDFNLIVPPVAISTLDISLLRQGAADFHLKSSSPAVGKGKTNFAPKNAVTVSGTFAPKIDLPGKDIGAYQTDGSGNQH